jgi:serine protease Do
LANCGEADVSHKCASYTEVKNKEGVKRMKPEKELLDRRLSVYKRMLFVPVLLVVGMSATCNQSGVAPSELKTALVNDANNTTAAAPGSYAEVVSRVAPAVVTVRSARRTRMPQQHPFLDDPLFREFFGRQFDERSQPPPERVQRGLGSGVTVSADGHILTNHHVVDGAEEITIELGDNRVLEAKVVGSDTPSDLAVLKVNASNLPVLALGDSDRVRIGDVALAIGNPLGLGQTVTAGIISAKGRATGLSDGSFESFLQTDAPINQGNSGGALVSSTGELIGINSQILSPSGGNIGIGFAIPSNMARNVMDQLIKTGKVRRGQLGITMQPVTAEIAASLGLKEVRGVIINAVTPGSPAERAGLKQGDVIVGFNGAPIADSNSLRNSVAGAAPGTEVTLTIIRDGKEQQVRVTLGELIPQSGQAQPHGSETPGTGESKFGLSVSPLTPELASRLGVSAQTRGVVVNQIDPQGPAANAGLQQGDVIVQVNRQPVTSGAELQTALERTSDRPALLLVNRRGNNLFLTFRPRQR